MMVRREIGKLQAYESEFAEGRAEQREAFTNALDALARIETAYLILHTEVERLRRLVEGREDYIGSQRWVLRTSHDEEVGRLQRMLEWPCDESCAAQREEVERLRGELLEVHDKLAHADNEVERLQRFLDSDTPGQCRDCPGGKNWEAEAERLNEQIKQLRSGMTNPHQYTIGS